MEIGNQTFNPTDAYPITGTPPAWLQPYLAATASAQSDDLGTRGRASSTVSGSTTEYEAVVKLAKWIIDNITYNGKATADDAVSVLSNRSGKCEGFSNLMIAFLRSLKIPARNCVGVVAAGRQDFPSGAFVDYVSAAWHCTYEVYYASPFTGWKSGDAQTSVHMVSNHNLIYARGLDASVENSGLITCPYSVPVGDPPPTATSPTSVTLKSFSNNSV